MKYYLKQRVASSCKDILCIRWNGEIFNFALVQSYIFSEQFDFVLQNFIFFDFSFCSEDNEIFWKSWKAYSFYLFLRIEREMQFKSWKRKKLNAESIWHRIEIFAYQIETRFSQPRNCNFFNALELFIENRDFIFISAQPELIETADVNPKITPKKYKQIMSNY